MPETPIAGPADATAGKATLIRGIDYLLAYDAEAGTHRMMRDADMAFRGGRFVDPASLAAEDIGETIDGRGRMILPGFVDIHAHPGFETMLKGLTEEVGSLKLQMSSLYEYLFLFDTTHAGMVAATQVALSELMQSGVTTICDISTPHAGWIDTLGASGMRAIAAPMFREARWYTPNGHEVLYDWDEAAGETRMAAALAEVDAALAHPSGRLSGMICPAQIDTCSREMFEDARDAARARGLKIQTHAAQSVVEFQEIMRRHGETPIGWLDKMGMLGEDMIVGHGIFLDHNDWLGWPERRDIGLLAESGTSVAHCPTVFVRRGIALQDVGKYVREGVNVGIGTDTYPHNFIEEMRNGIYAARVSAHDVRAANVEIMIHAATLGGAKALGRDDLGRIAPGAKADFFTVDLDDPSMRPVFDPLRSLVYSAGDRPVRDVYVDGARVVKDGTALAFDMDDALTRLEAAQKASVAEVHKYDWAGRPAETLMPPAFGA
ncbi:amidohydrolase family protein [Marinibacterium sp. SX1]|uniref:amidohydrolase family protein n=1 Tax=Marinibacterium sp. SX1 TaxID=3388424 RepID=UPI003D168B91